MACFTNSSRIAIAQRLQVGVTSCRIGLDFHSGRIMITHAHDRHLGVFIEDARPESVQAVKGKLIDKFHDKGRIMPRLPILSGPQIRFQLLRCCVSTRPGFWLRIRTTVSPSLTHDAASWFDSRMRDCQGRRDTGVLFFSPRIILV